MKKNTLPQSIRNEADVKRLIGYLIDNDKMFHFEDNALDITKADTMIPLFSEKEANKINKLFSQAFKITDVWELINIDPKNNKVTLK